MIKEKYKNLSNEQYYTMLQKEADWFRFHEDQRLINERWLNHFKDYPQTLEDAFNRENKNCIYYANREDYTRYIESLEYDKYLISRLDWHHLLKEKPPKK